MLGDDSSDFRRPGQPVVPVLPIELVVVAGPTPDRVAIRPTVPLVVADPVVDVVVAVTAGEDVVTDNVGTVAGDRIAAGNGVVPAPADDGVVA